MRRLWTIPVVTILLAFWFAHPMAAQSTYPQPADRYISDFADLITPEDEVRLRQMLIDLEERSDVEGTVVTIDSIADYNTGDPDIESFAAGLFNAWGIGQAQSSDGLLVLVAIEDRAMRIELGAEYRREYNTALQQIIDEEMIPLFSEGMFSQGILQGTQSTIDRIIGPRERAKENPEVSFPTPVSQPQGMSPAQPVQTPRNIWPWVIGFIVLVVLAVIGFNFYRLRLRTQPRRCPNCDEFMVHLDEETDDLHLDSGQKVEEYLNSVDYDVWKCPNCDLVNVYPNPRIFSRYSECPTCNYQTLERFDRILEHPTVYANGRKEIVDECHHCSHYRSEVVVLPRVRQQSRMPRSGGPVVAGGGMPRVGSNRPTSSSSSVFGGGKAGGGGASGRW